MTAFQLRAIRDNFFWWLRTSARWWCDWDRHPKSLVLMPMHSGLTFPQLFDEANGRAQFLSPPFGTNAWDAATRSPVISKAGRITVGPPGAVWEANNSMVWQ